MQHMTAQCLSGTVSLLHRVLQSFQFLQTVQVQCQSKTTENVVGHVAASKTNALANTCLPCSFASSTYCLKFNEVWNGFA